MVNQLKSLLKRQLKLKHPLLSISTTTGMSALRALNAGADFIMVLNSGKFRQMGRSSLGAYLPFTNSNRQIFDITKQEILPLINDFPCVIGINATDPYLSVSNLINFLKQYHISGVVNYPTVSLLDGQFREALSEANIKYDQEIELLETLHKQGVFTVAFVTNEKEALAANQVGVDVICIHLGLTEGGVLGARRMATFESIIDKVKNVCEALNQASCQSILMLYGGVINDLTEVRYIYNLLPTISGYIGGSTFERIIQEQTIAKQVHDFKTADHTPDDSLTIKTLSDDCLHYQPIQFIENYIQNNYSRPIRLADLAQILHLSPTYLSTMFKKQTNKSFTEYLVRFRLNKAVELMKHQEQSLSKIAELVGYSDYAQFNKIFKKYFGQSPSVYLKHI